MQNSYPGTRRRNTNRGTESRLSEPPRPHPQRDIPGPRPEPELGNKRKTERRDIDADRRKTRTLGFGKKLPKQTLALMGIGRIMRLHPAIRVLGLAYDLYQLWQHPGWQYPPGSKWVFIRQCPGPITSWPWYTETWHAMTVYRSTPCTASQPGKPMAMDMGGNVGWGTPVQVPAGMRTFIRCGYEGMNSSGSHYMNWQTAAFWHRYDDLPIAPAPVRGFVRHVVQPAPVEIPAWADPMSMPIGRPVPFPKAPPYRVIPHRQPNPNRSPDEQTERGPEPVPRPRPYIVPNVFPAPYPVTRPSPRPRPTPIPRPVPIPVPPTIVVPGPPAPYVVVNPDPTTRSRDNLEPVPMSRVRYDPLIRNKADEDTLERKVKMRRGKIAQALMAGVGFVPEFLDFANVLWDALPKHCKPGYYELTYRDKQTGELKKYWKRRFRANQAQRLQAVESCFMELDIKKVVKGLVANEIEDRQWGAVANVTNTTPGMGLRSNRGFQSGPWDTAPSQLVDQWETKNRVEADNARRAEEKRRRAYRDAIRKQKAIERARKAAQKAAEREKRKQAPRIKA